MKREYIATIFLMIAIGLTGCKKKGCTDPTADNYNPDAKKDDGSCTYTPAPTGAKETTLSDNGNGIGTRILYKDTTYFLEGFVFVNSGQTLTIQPGTVIKGNPGTGASASALIVARGGMINACGTSSEPIIFTFKNDPMDGSVPVTTSGQWGGVIVLGAASNNTVPATQQIEGIPTTEIRGEYGGTNDADNSGTLCYISIRHGGTDIGAGNEINGLTLGGVGSGTTIHHIEVIANADDGVEYFGGTVSTKHMITAFCGDDSYDYDQGWRGKGQFWFSVNQSTDGDRGGEHDGGTTPEDGTPYATPMIYNATYFGRGASAGKRAITFRDNAGGQYHNSVFVDYDKGVDIELLSSGQHSWERFKGTDLQLVGNVFHNVNNGTGAGIFAVSFGSGASSNPDSAGAEAALDAYFATAGNTVADPGITNDFSGGTINPVPTNVSNVSGGTASGDTWFDAVTYKGAFDPAGSNWMKGWTKLDDAGYLP